MQRIFIPPFPDIGDFSTESPATWISGNQPLASTKTVIDPITKQRVAQLQIQGASKDQQGARLFLNKPDGEWRFFDGYKSIGISYDFRMSYIPLVSGDGKWLTGGLEVKDEYSPNALIQTNIKQIGNNLYYWIPNLGTCHTPIQPNTYQTVTYEIDLSVDGGFRFYFGNDYLESHQRTISDKTGVAGFGFVFYGNNMPDDAAHTAYIRNIQAWVIE